MAWCVCRPDDRGRWREMRLCQTAGIARCPTAYSRCKVPIAGNIWQAKRVIHTVIGEK